MYKTRIVQVGTNYFVEYKWCGPFLSGLLCGESVWWDRYSMVPMRSIESARALQAEALESHLLNYSWNTKVVE